MTAVPKVTATGDELEGWYRTHRVELVRLAAFALGDVDAAHEVVQDLFAHLYRRPPELRDPSDARRYLRSAVLNRCRTGVSRAILGRRYSQRLAGQRQHEPRSTEDAGVGSATRDEVLAAVRRLPRLQRDVVLLRYWLDLPEAEIAATLGVSAGSVKTSAHRAMATLAPLLEDLR